MRYAEVCAGIHASGLAWPDWECAWVAEIDPFACSVLEQRAVGVPNLGDMTKITDEELAKHGPIDLLMGGTPCQSFSVAGLRKGLADPRGNLALAFLALACRTRARWLVWENVPGVLSATSHDAPDQRPPDDGVEADPRSCDEAADEGLLGEAVVVEDEYDAEEVHAFACFLAGLRELGYGFAYASLDAQFFGLAQRRERVFLVAHLGEWTAPAAVLLERACLRGDSPPRREAGSDVASAVTRGLGSGGADDNKAQANHLVAGGVPDLAKALLSPRGNGGGSYRGDLETETFVVAHSLRGEGFDASEDGTGRGTPLVLANTLKAYSGRQQVEATYVPCDPIAFHATQDPISGDMAPAIGQGNGQGCASVGVAYNVQAQFAEGRGPHAREAEVAKCLDGHGGNPDSQQGGTVVAFAQNQREEVRDLGDWAAAVKSPGTHEQTMLAQSSMVRRLTPKECLRLQGMPDDYLDITYRGKPAADGPKYKAIGNSIAVPCLTWIGRRIAIVDEALRAVGFRP